MDWVHECTAHWGEKVYSAPFGEGEIEQKCTEPEEMSPDEKVKSSLCQKH